MSGLEPDTDRSPQWRPHGLRRNVCHVCDGGPRRRIMYLETVDSAISNPSLSISHGCAARPITGSPYTSVFCLIARIRADVIFGNDREMTNHCRFAWSVPISIQMDADLPSLDQLRSNAAECIRLAEAARTSEHKSLFIEMAERWLTLAEHAVREGRLNGGSLFRDR
jgi:hypothetical protein